MKSMNFKDIYYKEQNPDITGYSTTIKMPRKIEIGEACLIFVRDKGDTGSIIFPA